MPGLLNNIILFAFVVINYRLLQSLRFDLVFKKGKENDLRMVLIILSFILAKLSVDVINFITANIFV